MLKINVLKDFEIDYRMLGTNEKVFAGQTIEIGDEMAKQGNFEQRLLKFDKRFPKHMTFEVVKEQGDDFKLEARRGRPPKQ